MPYCSRCGVEVDEIAENCPLCRAPIQKFQEDPAPGRTFPVDELPYPGPPKMTRKERIRLASVMTGFGILIPLLITLSVDLTLNSAVTWSVYPIIILTASLLIVLTALYFGRKPGLLMVLDFLIISTLLSSLNKFAGLPSAAVKIGTPIAFIALVSSFFAVFTSIRAKKKGANVAAFVLIGSGMFCIMTDLFLHYSLAGSLMPGWSLIVLAATQPVSMILLYLHFRKRKDSKLKKYFHI